MDKVDLLYDLLDDGEKQHMSNKLHKHGHVATKARQGATVQGAIEVLDKHLQGCSLSEETDVAKAFEDKGSLGYLITGAGRLISNKRSFDE